MAAPSLPPWLSSPSVTLTLSPSSPSSHLHHLSQCSCHLQDQHTALSAHIKETSWHLRQAQQQIEAEKACRIREKIEQVEAQVRKLREEEAMALDRIDADYREQLMALRRDAEAKEQKLVDIWAAKHAKVRRLIEQMGCCRR